MSDNTELEIDQGIVPYLNEIAERLWSRQKNASIMVGSGFSKNANPAFPDWADLGDRFYEKIHGKRPSSEQGDDGKSFRYTNVLKLADEVQAAFGRPSLHELLRASIPDLKSQPSELHRKLLNLPWADVFTTNYDTLLERASEQVIDRKYTQVINTEDLVYAERPRIIKLHGSLPSERPLIITEEDYRRYPHDYAPFVNTVQQSLIENTFCLIGFSGDDPNFLNWIGWIRDHLGNQNAAKIYLIGMLSLTNAQKKLLEQRNINLVDFGENPPSSGMNHHKALELFFDYIADRKEKNLLDWPEESSQYVSPKKKNRPRSTSQSKEAKHSESNGNIIESQNERQLQSSSLEEIIEELTGVTRKWKETRLRYPGWHVASKERRRELWEFTDKWATYLLKRNDIPTHIAFQFYYELNWRLEISLIPIYNDIVLNIENTLLAVWPSPLSSSIAETFGGTLASEEIKTQWLHLSLSLLRYYREEGMSEKWSEKKALLSMLTHFFTQEQTAFFYYEQSMQHLFQLDLIEIRASLNGWPENYTIPFWETKRAGLLAEIGESIKAEQVLKKSLQAIRSRLNIDSVVANYGLLFEEAITILMLDYIQGSNSFTRGEMDFKKRRELRQSFREREIELKKFGIDVWKDLESFSSQLEQPFVLKPAKKKSRTFDIGVMRTSISFGTSNSRDIWAAYQFARFFEMLSIPFQIPGSTLKKKSAVGAARRLMDFSPYWAFIILLRAGDTKSAEMVFDRSYLDKKSQEFIDQWIKRLTSLFSNSRLELGDLDPNFSRIFTDVIPSILSHLVTKCSRDSKHRILSFIASVYQTTHQIEFSGVRDLLIRFMNSINACEFYYFIPEILKIEYPGNLDALSEHEILNPFLPRQVRRKNIAPPSDIIVPIDTIQHLIRMVESEDDKKRDWGAASLIGLYSLNLVPQESIDSMVHAIWCRRSEDGFPPLGNFRKFVFLELPHPSDVNPVPLFKEYLMNRGFPAQSDSSQQGVYMTGGDSSFSDEFIGSKERITWDDSELSVIFDRLVDWWQKDKHYLNSSSGISDIREEFVGRFYGLTKILSELVLPSISTEYINSNIFRIKEVIADLRENRISYLPVKTALYLREKEDGDLLLEAIVESIQSYQKREVVDAFNSIFLLLSSPESIEDSMRNDLLNLLTELIRWRYSGAVVSCLHVLARIVLECDQNYNGSLEQATLRSLGILAQETASDSNWESGDIMDKLEIREAAALLSFRLFKYYSKNKRDMPKEIEVWKNISASDQEFGEIRAQWDFCPSDSAEIQVQ